MWRNSAQTGKPLKGGLRINGKVVYKNDDAEASVIGNCLDNPMKMGEVAKLLTPKHFYNPQRGRIFGVMLELWDAGKSVGLITVNGVIQSRSECREAKDEEELRYCSSFCTGLYVNKYHEIVRNMYLRRQIILRLERSITKFSEDSADVDEFLSNHIDEFLTLRLHVDNNRYSMNTGDLNDRTLIEIENCVHARREGAVVGVPSGIDELDVITGGFRPEQFVVIAGRPSMGKSDLVINCAVNAAEKDHPVLFISLEMTAVEVWVRVLSLRSNVYRGKQFNGNLSEYEIKMLRQKGKVAKELPIMIVDKPRMKLSEIRATALEAKHRIGAELMILDYLGLVDPPKAYSREQEVARISAGLKGIARELQIPVIAVSQLNRSVESRQDKRPYLSDLRDSGALEQDADLVVLIFRENYYDRSKPDNLDLDICKHRNGSIELIKGLPYNRGIGRIGGVQAAAGSQSDINPEEEVSEPVNMMLKEVDEQLPF